MSEKNTLRQHIKNLTLALPPETKLRMSDSIIKRLIEHPRFRAAKVIMLYHSLPDEVCTHKLLQQFSSKKKLLLPIVKGDSMLLRTYHEANNMEAGAYGIMEPKGPAFTAYKNIDLIIIPGVAFDVKNNRLGRGKGYYDRFLQQMRQTHAYKIGICFPHQLVDSIPTTAYDIPMDEVLSLPE